jgi:lysophospholipase L1-like esterase
VPTRAWSLIAVGMAAVVVMAPLALRRGAAPPEATAQACGAAYSSTAVARPPTPVAGGRVNIAALGDSYTGGSAMDSGPPAEWPALLSRDFPWTVTPYALGGTGFVTQHGEPDTVFAGRVDSIISARPDVVIIAGGHNDAGQPPERVRSAALNVVTRLRAGLPVATLVIIGVFWPGEAPPNVIAVDDCLQQVAQDTGSPFADPLREGWLSGPDQRLIGSDGVHPTDEGHAVLARRIADALVAAGVPTSA